MWRGLKVGYDCAPAGVQVGDRVYVEEYGGGLTLTFHPSGVQVVDSVRVSMVFTPQVKTRKMLISNSRHGKHRELKNFGKTQGI